ncbi:unnamed protein product [Linum tenue]|uniref:Uncharacterized protein n=1 Tax=Linum tenue TaxID=586396 RepID=A0AAV0Q8I2_9ROSI|nr:unnamed protein product [Linum tenue]
MASFRLSTFVLLLLALSLLLPLLSSARYTYTTLSFSEDALTVVEGRALMKLSLTDYGEPSANQGHDPSQSKSRGRANDNQGRGGANVRRGRRRRD